MPLSNFMSLSTLEHFVATFAAFLGLSVTVGGTPISTLLQSQQGAISLASAVAVAIWFTIRETNPTAATPPAATPAPAPPVIGG